MKIFNYLIFLSGILIFAGCQTKANQNITDKKSIEEAQLQEREKIMEEYWEKNTESYSSNYQTTNKSSSINYPAGKYGDLIFAPRYTDNRDLKEPER
jgi:hypothetical protein